MDFCRNWVGSDVRVERQNEKICLYDKQGVHVFDDVPGAIQYMRVHAFTRVHFSKKGEGHEALLDAFRSLYAMQMLKTVGGGQYHPHNTYFDPEFRMLREQVWDFSHEICGVLSQYFDEDDDSKRGQAVREQLTEYVSQYICHCLERVIASYPLTKRSGEVGSIDELEARFEQLAKKMRSVLYHPALQVEIKTKGYAALVEAWETHKVVDLSHSLIPVMSATDVNHDPLSPRSLYRIRHEAKSRKGFKPSMLQDMCDRVATSSPRDLSLIAVSATIAHVFQYYKVGSEGPYSEETFWRHCFNQLEGVRDTLVRGVTDGISVNDLIAMVAPCAKDLMYLFQRQESHGSSDQWHELAYSVFEMLLDQVSDLDHFDHDTLAVIDLMSYIGFKYDTLEAEKRILSGVRLALMTLHMRCLNAVYDASAQSLLDKKEWANADVLLRMHQWQNDWEIELEDLLEKHEQCCQQLFICFVVSELIKGNELPSKHALTVLSTVVGQLHQRLSQLHCKVQMVLDEQSMLQAHEYAIAQKSVVFASHVYTDGYWLNRLMDDYDYDNDYGRVALCHAVLPNMLLHKEHIQLTLNWYIRRCAGLSNRDLVFKKIRSHLDSLGKRNPVYPYVLFAYISLWADKAPCSEWPFVCAYIQGGALKQWEKSGFSRLVQVKVLDGLLRMMEKNPELNSSCMKLASVLIKRVVLSVPKADDESGAISYLFVREFGGVLDHLQEILQAYEVSVKLQYGLAEQFMCIILPILPSLMLSPILPTSVKHRMVVAIEACVNMHPLYDREPVDGVHYNLSVLHIVLLNNRYDIHYGHLRFLVQLIQTVELEDNASYAVHLDHVLAELLGLFNKKDAQRLYQRSLPLVLVLLDTLRVCVSEDHPYKKTHHALLDVFGKHAVSEQKMGVLQRHCCAIWDYISHFSRHDFDMKSGVEPGAVFSDHVCSMLPRLDSKEVHQLFNSLIEVGMSVRHNYQQDSHFDFIEWLDGWEVDMLSALYDVLEEGDREMLMHYTDRYGLAIGEHVDHTVDDDVVSELSDGSRPGTTSLCAVSEAPAIASREMYSKACGVLFYYVADRSATLDSVVKPCPVRTDSNATITPCEDGAPSSPQP